MVAKKTKRRGRSHHWSPRTAIAISLFCSVGASSNETDAPCILRFRAQDRHHDEQDSVLKKHQVFKILQLADIHYGEAPDTAWGPRQDAKSFDLIQSLVQAEQPDLVVLSGDQLTADYIWDDALQVHARLVEAIRQVSSDIRWCLVMGNHDDHPYEVLGADGSITGLVDAKTTREELLRYDSELDGSCTVAGPLSTYALPILDDNSKEAAEIYIFDTGGGSIPERIRKDQVEWFVQTYSSAYSQRQRTVPAMAFQHIASNTNWAFDNSNKCTGTNKEGSTKTVKNDAGLFDAMIEHGDMHFVGVGHNHGKSYCCEDSNHPLHLCYGRHSGYGGYKKVKRGARVYELHLVDTEKEDTTATRKFLWKSWVRLEGDGIVDEYKRKKVKEYKVPLNAMT